MLKRYFKFLEEKFTKTIANNRVEYVYKTPPEGLRKLHEEMSKTKTIMWKPETLGIVTCNFGANEAMISDLKKREQYLLDHSDEYRLRVEPIPKWYYKLLGEAQSIGVVRGSLYLSSNPIKEMMVLKPECLNGFYCIGYYSGLTPESCPIFTDESGKMYVIGAKEFRNYPRNDSEKEVQRYLKSEVKLIKQWSNIEDFLIDETTRLEAKYAEEPSLGAVKNSCPIGESRTFEK